jgi:hypothetical protein
MTSVSYTPSKSFLAWLQKHRPTTVDIVKESKNLILQGEDQPGRRYKLCFPDLSNSVATVDMLIEFDRELSSGDFCLVLDTHPDKLV